VVGPRREAATDFFFIYISFLAYFFSVSFQASDLFFSWNSGGTTCLPFLTLFFSFYHINRELGFREYLAVAGSFRLDGVFLLGKLFLGVAFTSG
jgi:hypothetical protein